MKSVLPLVQDENKSWIKLVCSIPIKYLRICIGIVWEKDFVHGLSKPLRTNLKTQFDGGASYYKLLELARMIESENFHEHSTKVGAVTVDNTAQQIQQLQGAVKGLTKLLQGNKQNTQPQQIPQFVPNLNIDNSLPQNSQNQNPANPHSARGRGGFRGGGGRGRGRWRGCLVLCYWWRDFLPK